MTVNINPTYSSNLSISNGPLPPEGPRGFAYSLDFSAGGDQTSTIDLSVIYQQRNLSGIQSAYIDNSDNASTVTVSCPATGQDIAVGTGQQGAYPVIASLPPVFVVSCTGGTGIVKLIFLNVPLANQVWNVAGPAGGFQFDTQGNLLTHDALLDALISGGRLLVSAVVTGTVAVTGTVTVGAITGTPTVTVITSATSSQVLVAADPARRLLLMQAPPLDGVWIFPNGAAVAGSAGAPSANGSIWIGPGALLELSTVLDAMITSSIQVIGTTTSTGYPIVAWTL